MSERDAKLLELANHDSLTGLFNRRRLVEELKKEKEELCVKAEAITDPDDWNAATSEIIKLQREGKEIGPTHRGDEQKLWKRFRTICDNFFEAKRKTFESFEI